MHGIYGCAGDSKKDTGDMVTMIRKKKKSKTKKKEGNGVNTSTTVDEDREGGVDVFVSNELVHVVVSEARFFKAMVVVAIMSQCTMASTLMFVRAKLKSRV